MPTLMFGYVGHDLLHSFSLGWFESAQWVEILYDMKVFCIQQCSVYGLIYFHYGSINNYKYYWIENPFSESEFLIQATVLISFSKLFGNEITIQRLLSNTGIDLQISSFWNSTLMVFFTWKISWNSYDTFFYINSSMQISINL